MKDLLIKFKEEVSKHGKLPEERTLEELFDKGYVNLDKDAGPTSHESTDNLKNILGIPKAGHSGTLDPKVTGVLLIGLGKATRLMEYMLKSNKEYVCLMYLHKEVSEDEIREAMKKFTGKIMQTPPIISAVKRQEREREIYSIEILDIKDKGQNVLYRVKCQHGTYIRKLCSDIGEYLGVNGQMVELRRTKAGPVHENHHIISLDKLRNLYNLYKKEKDEKRKEILYKELKTYIRPQEELLIDFKKVYLRCSAVDSISRGSDLAIPGICSLEKGIEMGEEVAVMTLKGELVAMGTAYMDSKTAMKKKKGAFVKTNKVFMEPGVYPRLWEFEQEEEEQENI